MNTNHSTSSLNTSIETRDLEVYDNTNEIAIKINESKARIIYKKYFKAVNGGTVLSFFGMFLTCITTVFTATFHDIFNISNSASILNTSFIVLSIAFAVFTIILFFKWISSLRKLNENSFIDELKGSKNFDNKYKLFSFFSSHN